MFSLGATLAFAATGHAPYRGETVMDVLVRLATEPPDLAGLPAELDGIVTACLARSPRQRPTSAALLDQLGDFTAAAGPRSAHAYLPAPAMAVISGYQCGPRQAAGARADGGEDTSGGAGDGAGEDTSGSTGEGIASDATIGSHAALPAPTAAQRPLRRGARRLERPGPAGDSPGTAPRPVGDRRGHRALITAGLAGAAAALVVGGVIVGVSLPNRQGTPRTGGTAQGFPPPGPPPSAFPTAPSGPPQIRMLQPLGDPDTVFLIHGTGWVPRSRVTVTLAGHGESPIRPVVDMRGTFNYAVNQGHEFFPQGLPPGVYQVVVTGPGGRRAWARFQVNPPPVQGPPTGQAAGAVRMPGSTTGPPAGNTRPDRSAGPGQRA